MLTYDYPTPRNLMDLYRWEHTRLRRRLLYGRQDLDIEARIRSSVGSIRQDAWGPVDLTSNPFLHVWSQLAALYREPPELTIPAGGDLVAAQFAAGYFPLAPRIQRDTLGLREMLVGVNVTPEGDLLYEPIYPDLVEILACDPWRPSRPTALRIWRRSAEDASAWLSHLYDVRGAGLYQVEDRDGRPQGEPLQGAAYPWQIDGRPVLPVVVYHAEPTGGIWDPFTGREVVEGSLQLGVLLSFYSHVVRSAAWGQRYAVGAQPVGTATSPASAATPGGASEVVTDPSTLLILEPMESEGGNTQILVGQWASPADPEKILSSIIRYERRLVEMAVGAAEVARSESDIRSGYSLAVSREAQVQAQISYEPAFRAADLELLRLSAGLLGAPVDGWEIRYPLVERARASVPGGAAPAGAAGAAGASIQQTALNGAQVQAAQQIIVEVAAGRLPRATAQAMLSQFFQLSPDSADALLGPVGLGFTPTPPKEDTDNA